MHGRSLNGRLHFTRRTLQLGPSSFSAISALGVSILTVAAVCCAIVNFRQKSLYTLPDDGVVWVDRNDAGGQTSVVALHVVPSGEADNVGIRAGDALIQVAGVPIHKASDVSQALAREGKSGE